jgi:hypothetical protein
LTAIRVGSAAAHQHQHTSTSTASTMPREMQ